MNEQLLEPALKMSAKYIKSLTAFPDADDRISLYLQSLLSSFRPAKDSFSAQSDDTKPSTEPAYLTTIHYFTVKEIAKMDKTFKKVFIANGLAAHASRLPNELQSAYFPENRRSQNFARSHKRYHRNHRRRKRQSYGNAVYDFQRNYVVCLSLIHI